MGLVLSRKLSDPYYASYENAFQRLTSDKEKLQAKRAARRKRLRTAQDKLLFFSVSTELVLIVLIAWVINQPAGTYSTKGHFARVSPVFLWPLLVYWVNTMLSTVGKWRDSRDEKKVKYLDKCLKKQLSDLKDSTRVERTLALLRKYDPDYRIPAQPMPIKTTAQAVVKHNPPQAVSNTGLLSPTVLAKGVGKLGNILDGMSHMMGDNPVLVESLRTARKEAAALREQLARTAAEAQRLAMENQELHARLGDVPEGNDNNADYPEGPSSQLLASESDIGQRPAEPSTPGAATDMQPSSIGPRGETD